MRLNAFSTRTVRLSSIGAAAALLFVSVGGVSTAYADEIASVQQQAIAATGEPLDAQSLAAVVGTAAVGGQPVGAETPVAEQAATTSSSGISASTAAIVADPTGAQAVAWQQVQARGWGTDQFACLVQLWQKESGWRVNAANSSSGAYGIPQALPGSKMASAGADWQTNAATQITWGLGYISGRYGTPCGAWSHSQSVGWY